MMVGVFAGACAGGGGPCEDDDDPDGRVGGSDGETLPVSESGFDFFLAEERSSPRPNSEWSALAEE